MFQTIVIYTKFKRLILYKQLTKNLKFRECIFSKKLNNSLKGDIILIDEHYLNHEYKNLINYIKKNNNNKIYIIFWNGFLSKILFNNKINILRKKYNYINFYFLGASSFDFKEQRKFNNLFSKNVNMKINYKYKNFHLKFLLVNIKFFFDCLLFFKKVYLFKSKSNFIFVGQWKFNRKDISKLAKIFNINLKSLNSFLKDINYYSNEEFLVNNLKFNRSKHKNLFKNFQFNYFIYNLVIRKKIILSLKKHNKIQIIDDYSKPDFLNFRFKTKSIFLDFGSKYGSNISYPRQFSLKINYPNNNVHFNYFHNKEANIKNLLNSFDYIRLICDKINNNSQKKILNKKLFNNFRVK